MDIAVAPEVAAALEDARPVVALESTIIAHGFPRPDNLELARALHAAVREAGAVPAMIAVIDGVIRVGLDADDLARLAGEPPPPKCATADLAPLIASGSSGATTVSATLRIAAEAGIAVIATGGIGGVHRGAPFDVSADLFELARARVAVICSGAKAVLDIPATLEVLESHGVPVIGYGCDAFPAFYARTSGCAVRHRADSPEDAAMILRAHWRFEAAGGVVIAQPPPAGAVLAPDQVAVWVEEALTQASKQGMSGPDLTPHLLAALDELSGGRTRACNRALALANAHLAARIAEAL